MEIIATFSVAATGIPTIVELSQMPVTRHWLPGEGGSGLLQVVKYDNICNGSFR